MRRALDNPAIAIALCLATLIPIASIVRGLNRRANQWDFSHYYVSAFALREGENPYNTRLSPLADSLGLQIGEIDRAGYPPTFLVAFEPLTVISPRAAYLTWITFSTLCLAAGLVLLIGPESGLGRYGAWSLAAFAILYLP